LIGVPLGDNPDLATDPATALKVAIGFWTHARRGGKTCNEMADADDIVGITYAVNGGQIGIDERRRWLEKTKALWLNAATVAAGAASGADAPAPSANSPTNPSPPAQTAPPARPQQAPAPPAPQQAPQHAPPQRGGTTFSAIIAFITGAVAFISAIFNEVHNWLHEQRMTLWRLIGFDPLWIVGAIFVLAILWVIFVRLEHKNNLKKAAGG
jgi:hypothetical protein